MKRLIIVGAGPKALAIAAKAAVLRQLGYDAPGIDIIEKDAIGANWYGGFGYTDGEQDLETPPQKDLGFPYDSNLFRDDRVDQLMMAEYSWQAYLIDTHAYAEWVDRGRFQPTLREWADYLRWAAKRTRAKIRRAEVRRIEGHDNRWRLMLRNRSGALEVILGDELVITGPGEPFRFRRQPRKHERVYDAKNFWENLEVFRRLRHARGRIRIGVIGSGGAAAGVVLGLLKAVEKGPVAITIVNRHGAVFSRGESYDETKLFSRPDGWLYLPMRTRKEYLSRTDHGVFSIQSKRVVDHAKNVAHQMVEIKTIRVIGNEAVVVAKSGERFPFDFVVNALGFDAFSFVQTIHGPQREQLERQQKRKKVKIAQDLSVTGIQPKLYLPMAAAGAQGPGFPNLGCLSALSDRILGTKALLQQAPQADKGSPAGAREVSESVA